MKVKELQCVVHAGMHKTGTTSIQTYLSRTRNAHSEFIYCNFGWVSSNDGFLYLFVANPFNRWAFKSGRLKKEDFDKHRAKALLTLEGYIDQAIRENKGLLFSWEDFWNLPEADLRYFHDFMESRGFSVKIILYIRLYKSKIESGFQQQIKFGLSDFNPGTLSYKLGFRQQIEKLENIFGSQSLTPFKYDPILFPNGNIVRHICSYLGISYDASMDRRINESLSLSAVKLIYAHNKFGGNLKAYEFGKYGLFLKALAPLKGAPFRLHSSVIEPILPMIHAERAWLENRLGGVPMQEDIFASDEQPYVIRNEADMFRYEPEALAWLANKIGSAPVLLHEGEAAAVLVAQQIGVFIRMLSEEQTRKEEEKLLARRLVILHEGILNSAAYMTGRKKMGTKLWITLNYFYWPIKKKVREWMVKAFGE